MVVWSEVLRAQAHARHQSYIAARLLMLLFASFGSDSAYEGLSYNVLRQLSLGYPNSYYKVFTTKHLPDEYNEYGRTHPRGYGYFLWKPYIIKHCLDSLAEDDVLLYVDGRSGIDHEQQSVKWLDRFVSAPQYDLAAWQMDLLEQAWTTQDLIHAMGNAEDLPSVESGQFSATYHAWRCNSRSRSFVDNWLNSMHKHKDLCRDETLFNPTVLPNHDQFKENRYDQSVFSLQLKNWLKQDSINLMLLSTEELRQDNLRIHKYSHPVRQVSLRERIARAPRNMARRVYRSLVK